MTVREGNPASVTISVPRDEYRNRLTSAIDAPQFRGWPRKPMVGTVDGDSFLVMKRRRSTLDLFYFACRGHMTSHPEGVSVGLSFERSVGAPFLEYAWLPVVGIVLLANVVMLVSQIYSGGFSPLYLLPPIMPITMLVVGVGLQRGLRSQHRSEREEILRFLNSLGKAQVPRP